MRNGCDGTSARPRRAINTRGKYVQTKSPKSNRNLKGLSVPTLFKLAALQADAGHDGKFTIFSTSDGFKAAFGLGAPSQAESVPRLTTRSKARWLRCWSSRRRLPTLLPRGCEAPLHNGEGQRIEARKANHRAITGARLFLLEVGAEASAFLRRGSQSALGTCCLCSANRTAGLHRLRWRASRTSKRRRTVAD